MAAMDDSAEKAIFQVEKSNNYEAFCCNYAAKILCWREGGMKTFFLGRLGIAKVLVVHNEMVLSVCYLTEGGFTSLR